MKTQRSKRALPICWAARCAGTALLATGLAGAANAEDAQLILKGHIQPVCDVAEEAEASERIYPGDMTEGGDLTMRLRVVCNTNMVATVVSRHGGFRNDAAAENGWTGGDAVLGYRLSAAVDSDPLLADIPSSQLAEALGGMQTPARRVISDDASLTLNMSWDSSDRLYAGRYQDVITVSVRPAS